MSCEGVKSFSEKLFMSREGVRLFSKKMFMSCEGVFYFMNENVYPMISTLQYFQCRLLIPKSISDKLTTAPSVSFFTVGILLEKADDSGIPISKAAGFALLLTAQLANQNSTSELSNRYVYKIPFPTLPAASEMPEYTFST